MGVIAGREAKGTIAVATAILSLLVLIQPAPAGAFVAGPSGVYASAVPALGGRMAQLHTSPRVPLLASSAAITTFAGGVGAGVAINVAQNPYYVAIQGGSLYLTDYDDSVVRVVDLATGDEQVIAGNGLNGRAGDGGPASAAEVAQPAGIAFDAAGNIYIGDEGDQTVRVIAESSVPPVFSLVGAHCSPVTTACTWTLGDIYTVAGDATKGTKGYAGDGGPAFAAELDDPTGIAIDAQGDIFVADQLNNAVREIASHSGTQFGIAMSVGDIYTIAGNGQQVSPGAYQGVAPLSVPVGLPQGIYLDAAGDLFIGQDFNSQASVLEVPASAQTRYGIAMQSGLLYTVAGNPGTTVCAAATDTVGDGCPALAAQLTDPSGQVVDPSGDLFTVDYYDERIREVSASTGIMTTVAGNGKPGYPFTGPAAAAMTAYPTALVFDPSGSLYVADSDGVAKVDLSASTVSPVAGTPIVGNESGDGGPAPSAELDDPQGLAADAAGDVFFADTGNNVVREVAGTGHTQFGIAMVAGDIYKVAGDGADLDRGDGGPAASGSIGEPLGVAVDGNGDLFIACGIGGVREVPSVSGTYFGTPMTAGDIYTVSTSVAGLQPAGIAAAPSGSIFVSNTAGDDVVEIDAATGRAQVFAGNGIDGFSGDGGPAVSAELFQPGSLAYGSGGLYVADAGNQRVRRVDLSAGDITTVAGIGSAGYSGDGGPATSAALSAGAVALDSAGNLYIGDATHFVVREVLAATGVITTALGNGTQGSPGQGDGGLASVAELTGPQGIAFDGSGDLFVSDYIQGSVFGSGPNVAGSRIRKISDSTATLTVATTSLPAGVSGTAYSASLTGVGGLSPYAWSVTGGSLPPGLSLSPTGFFSGTPTTTGAWPVTVTVTDSSSPPQSASSTFSITVAPGVVPLEVISPALPGAIVGDVYSESLAASGGTPPYGWSVTGGSLPPGLSLSPVGVVSGTPSSSGSFSVTVAVSDSSAPALTATEGLTLVVSSTSPGAGYWMLDGGGTVYAFGAAQNYGTATDLGSAVAMAPFPGGIGYWVVSAKGFVDAFGAARTFALSATPSSAVVTVASSHDGHGYWLATAWGQVITAGDAMGYGSPVASGTLLNRPIVDMVPTPDGLGYWLLAADGGVFSYGDASFYGSTGAMVLNSPAVAMAPTGDGGGYWFVASDGGVFTFGDAHFYGSMGAVHLNKPVDGIVPTGDGGGYWFVASDGGVFSFGDAGFVGSLGSNPPWFPIISMAAA